MSRSSYSTEEERKLLARVLGEADLESNYVYGVPFVYQYVSGNVETFKLDGTLLRMFASEWEA